MDYSLIKSADFCGTQCDIYADEAFNFRMAFADVENDGYRFLETVEEFSRYHWEEAEQDFNDTTYDLL